MPYILDLYLLYSKIVEDENKYIRDNINDEEAHYQIENQAFNAIFLGNNSDKSKAKGKSISKIKTTNSKSFCGSRYNSNAIQNAA